MKKLLLIASIARSAEAAPPLTETVCASGCNYTSLYDAGNSAATGTIIQVQSTYSSATETFPIQLRNASTTIQCAAGVTVQQSTASSGDPMYNVIQLTNSSTVRDCTFSNINLYVGSNAYRTGILIDNNTFTPATTGTISLNSQMANVTIQNNTNLDSISFTATSTGVTISQNTFYGNNNPMKSGLMLNTVVTSTNMVVSENYFYSYFPSTSTGSNLKLIMLVADGVTFTTNTVRYMVTPPAALTYTAVIASEGGVHQIYGNKIESPARGALDVDPCVAFAVYPNTDRAQSLVVRAQNNTFRNRCGGGVGLAVTDNNYSSITGYVSSTKNVFYADVPSAFKMAMEFSRQSGSSLMGTISQNALYGYSGLIQNQAQADLKASNTYEMNPLLQLSDANTANDLDVAPFSIYLDINGAGSKIGASTGTRRTTIYVDDNGSVDYSTVDLTSLAAVSSTIRSGDTVSIAAGTYAPLELNSSYATTSLTFTGAGESTIISASTNQNALSFTNVTSSVVSNLVVRDASSVSNVYSATRMNFVYGVNTYADALGPAGANGNDTLFLNSLDPSNNIIVASDGDSVTNVTGMGSENLHLVLMEAFGSRLTVFVPASLTTSSQALAYEWGGMGINVDRYVTDTFVVSGGVYTYNAAAIAAAGVTLVGGVSTPAITSSLQGYAGIKLISSGGFTMSGVTSTNNAYGMWFQSGEGDRLYDSALSSNALYDVRQDATATNTIDNITFNRTSSTVTGAGPILVKFRARASVYRATDSNAKISGSTVTATDASTAVTSLGATNGSGLTSYARLPAYTITSGSNAVTNGGYNSYTVTAGAVTGYAASSATITLSSRDQDISIAMVSNVAPTAPTSPNLSVGSTSATFWWADNSDDETGFTIDYATSSDVSAFPGTTSSTSAATTTFSNLFPNYPYIFRVAAVGAGGTSSYATSTAIRTLAATPGAPTLTAGGRTTATIVLDANGNSSATKFLVYNSTLGSYVTSTGASAASADWQTTSTWATVTISGLTCGTAYSFVTVARNENLVLTATSTAGTVTTSDCEVSGGGGGGGGGATSGGGGGSFTPSIVPPVVPPAPVQVVPTPVVTNLPEKTLDPAVETRIEAVLAKDYKEFKTKLPPATQDRLTRFIAFGEGLKTQSWGEGERRALVRDALDTLGDKINLVDMERVAEGNLPLTRNLARERVQLARVRQTFRTIYKRDPNFKNAQENMAWNAMMYRLRFERDLVLERQGVAEFRTLFRRTPTDPFQWAVVRVLGYVLR